MSEQNFFTFFPKVITTYVCLFLSGTSIIICNIYWRSQGTLPNHFEEQAEN